MGEAEYPLEPLEGEPAPGADAARVPGNPRLLLLALVLSLLALPVVVFDNLPGPAQAEAVAAADPDGTALATTTSVPGGAKHIDAVTDREARLEAAYEETMAERRARAEQAEAEAEEAEAEQESEEAAAAEPEDDDEAAAAPTTETTQAPTSTRPPAAPPTSAAPAPAPVGDVWGRLAQCESGGNWAHRGSYHGGLQFHPSTWVAYGGTQYAPYAYQASASQQIAVAERIVASSGGSYRAWPGCRAKLGLP